LLLEPQPRADAPTSMSGLITIEAKMILMATSFSCWTVLRESATKAPNVNASLPQTWILTF